MKTELEFIKCLPKNKSEVAKQIFRYFSEMKEHGYLPVKVRSVHYNLLSNHTIYDTKKNEVYGSKTKKSADGEKVKVNYYTYLSELLTKLRLKGLIDFDWIDENGRRINKSSSFDGVQDYFSAYEYHLKNSYSRNLQATQKDLIFVISEKTSFESLVSSVCNSYCIPYQLGGGMSSITVRHKLKKLFVSSGKERLVLLYLSDLDESGENIARSFENSLLNDFGFTGDNLISEKILLTPEQAKLVGSAGYLKANDKKIKSLGNRSWKEYSGLDYFYELDVLPHHIVKQVLIDSIERYLNLQEFERQKEIERQELDFLTSKQITINLN